VKIEESSDTLVFGRTLLPASLLLVTSEVGLSLSPIVRAGSFRSIALTVL